MYHIALFTFQPQFFAAKLESFVAGDWRCVESLDTTPGGAATKPRSVTGRDKLPGLVYDAFPGHWMVFQRHSGLERPLPDHARYRFPGHNDIAELDEFLSELARRNVWAVIPWGGMQADECFAFVTGEGWRLERFLTKSPNVAMLPWYRVGLASFRIVHTDLLLAQHAVARSLVDTATVALTEEADGGFFWNACVNDAEGDAVWFAGPCARAGPDGRTLEDMAAGGELEAIEPILGGDEGAGDDHSLYRVRRRDVFTRLLPWARKAGGGGCQALPVEIPCGRAAQMIREYLTDTDPQSIARVGRVIARAPWFYAAGECHEDAAYSRFGTRRNELLARYVSATYKGGFELVALF